MKTLQQVLSEMSDAEALSVWKLLGEQVENGNDVECPSEDTQNAERVVGRLDAVIAGLAEVDK